MDEQQEKKIYNNYRAMMKKRNKTNGNHSGYPSYWRQLAREACVNRYNVSYQEVKRIVAKYDVINGITHEKQPAQNNRLNKPEHYVPHPEKFAHKWPARF